MFGFAVGTDTLAVALDAVERVGVGRPEDLRAALRAVVAADPQQWRQFDQAWRLFWRAVEGRAPDAALADQTLGASVARRQLRQELERRARQIPWFHATRAEQVQRGPSGAASSGNGDQPGWLVGLPMPAGDAPTAQVHPGGYSPSERLRRAQAVDPLEPETRAWLERLIARSQASLPLRRSRRLRPSPRGRHWDAARTVRQALQRGGELLRPVYQETTRQARPVVLLCDISGSMEPYVLPLLMLAYALAADPRHASGWGNSRRRARVETFAFGTRLTRLTRHLAGRANIEGVLTRAARQVVDWAGGTRIGENLARFNRIWSRRLLQHGAVVVIVSDGWDRSDPALVGRELRRLQRRTRRLIWANPLASTPGYRPATAAMQTALPYIDSLAGAGNPVELERLIDHIRQAASRAPVRPSRR